MRNPDVEKDLQKAEVLPDGVAIQAPDDAGRIVTVYVEESFLQEVVEEL